MVFTIDTSISTHIKSYKWIFGFEHLKAIVALMAVDSMPLLVDETVKSGVVGKYVISPHVDLTYLKSKTKVLFHFPSIQLECFPLHRKKTLESLQTQDFSPTSFAYAHVNMTKCKREPSNDCYA